MKAPSKRKGKRDRAVILTKTHEVERLPCPRMMGNIAKLYPNIPLALSPMNTFAGDQLKNRNEINPPSIDALMTRLVRFASWRDITIKTIEATIPWQVAIPSIPSMKL